ncbi:RNA polymerase sigma factor [Streptomyces sp. NPDC097640]|uniref:RNA polymerase sigma factor n=1 Tax=Streptomyces sp. NPDC097640 TaxID=3157229 RepID=UPI00332E3EE8
MEKNLRARIRDGDPEAFGALFDACARSVYNHAYRLTGDWSTAEDMVSLTFLEAWRLRARIDPEGGSLRPWLLGIATNTVRNVRRAARRHTAAVHRLPRQEAVRDFADDVASRIDDAELLASVTTALKALRRPEREVLALCVWSGLDYAAAAEALGIPVGTVRSRLSRARKKLAAAAEKAAGKVAEKAAEKAPEKAAAKNNREPALHRAQVRDGRTPAARPIQEGNR